MPSLRPIDALLLEWHNSQVKRERDIAEALKRLSDAVMKKEGMPEDALPANIGTTLDQSFVTVDAETGLTDSRQLAAGTGIQLTDNGALSTLEIETIPGYLFTERKVAYITWAAQPGDLQQQQVGEFITIAGTGQSDVLATTTETEMCRYTTVATTGNNAGINGGAIWMFGLDFDVYCRMRLNQLTNERFWFAMVDCTVAQLLANDTFTVDDIAGFRFSTVAGDSNFRAITQKSTADITNVDTGVVPSTTASQLLQISYRASTGYVTFYIDGVQVAQSTAYIPDQVLRFVFGVQTRENVSKTIDMAWLYEEQRRPI